MTLYAIGDVHGQRAQLDRALALIETDGGSDAEVVFVGDYVDRGPDSRGVLDLLVEGREAGRRWTCLKGNHDRMMGWALQDFPRHDPHLLVEYYWLHERLGGDTTLTSYGVDTNKRRRFKDVHADAREAVPQAHRDFLASLSLSHETETMFFAHAGIRPGIPLAAQDEEDLLWIRQEFLKHEAPHPKLIIHGHTPVDAVTHYGNRINLDGGAGFGRPLIPVALEDGFAFTLSDAGREPLIPLGNRDG